MNTPYSLDLTRLAAAYADGTLAPQQVAREVLARSARRDGDHVWIHRLSADEVLAQAARLPARPSRALPLYGVPFAVKDNIDVAGCPTTAACPAYRYIAHTSATAVQRLFDAGAILIGKTNLDQFATGLTGTRSPYGACRNTFDARYISGGSSSGSAVAVAAGLVSFALGTDTAGSGRVPAALNNLVGLKPTRGAISTAGVVPACRSLDCMSVFALTCEDAQTVFAVARGHDAADIYSRAPTAAAPLRVNAVLRFGVPSKLEFFGDDIARRHFIAALARCAEVAGHPAQVDLAPFLDTAQLLYHGPWVAERLAAIRAFFNDHADQLLPVIRDIIGSAQRYSAADTFDAFYRLERLKQRCAAEWHKMDVLVVPSVGTIYTRAEVEAQPIELNTNLGYYTNFVNLLDLCAVAVPCGLRSDGLPAGITLIAPAWNETALLALGSRLHRECGGALGATGHVAPARVLQPGLAGATSPPAAASAAIPQPR